MGWTIQPIEQSSTPEHARNRARSKSSARNRAPARNRANRALEIEHGGHEWGSPTLQQEIPQMLRSFRFRSTSEKSQRRRAHLKRRILLSRKRPQGAARLVRHVSRRVGKCFVGPGGLGESARQRQPYANPGQRPPAVRRAGSLSQFPASNDAAKRDKALIDLPATSKAVCGLRFHENATALDALV